MTKIFEVFGHGNMDKWEAVIDEFSSDRKEIYHTANYYKTWIEHEQAKAFCFYARIEDKVFIYPFFLKSIEGYGLDKQYYDIFTAYGYGGVLTDGDPGIREIFEFNGIFNDWCSDNNVVAEFLRQDPLHCHPVRDIEFQHVRFNIYASKTGEYEIPDESARRKVKKAIKSGLTAEIDKELETMDDFISLYKLTMERKGMDKFYNFTSLYFNNIIEYLKDYTTLINIKKGNITIASLIVFIYNEIANFHLGASDFRYMQYRMNDLLTKEAIDYCISKGCKIINIGGGTTVNPDDPLFAFKKKFGNLIKPVRIGKRIHNPDIYQYLVNEWEKRNPGMVQQKKNIFLRYRIK